MNDPSRVAPSPAGESGAISALRTFLFIVLGLGVVGTLAELLLLEHTEDFWQLVPVGLLGLCLAVMTARVAKPTRATLRAFQAVMLLCVVSGLVGLYLHYQGNAEFELEMYPSLTGLDLLWESLKGATPTLAPGTMTQLGLIGLAYSYRHPLLTR